MKTILFLLLIIFSCKTDQDIEGIWIKVDHRPTNSVDSISIYDDFSDNFSTTYTLLTDSGYFDHVYIEDTLSKIVPNTNPIMDVVSVKNQPNINLAYVSFYRSDTGAFTVDRLSPDFTKLIFSMNVDKKELLKNQLGELMYNGDRYRRIKNAP